MAWRTVRRLLRGASVLVVGSAPPGPEDREARPGVRIVAVNGGLGRVTAVPTVWVLNSRRYDDWQWLDPSRWPPERRRLHDLMLAQGRGRRVRHLLLLMKSDSTDQTIARLRAQRTTWRGRTDVWSGTKADLLVRAGITDYAVAFNVSAGVSAAGLALLAGATEVALTGFSFSPGYTYTPEAVPRQHVQEDCRALLLLQHAHPGRLWCPPGVQRVLDAQNACPDAIRV